MEGFDAYISSNGYFVVPEFNINFLVNLQESSLPSMPSSTESTAKVAGRDGDIVLSTTYDPLTFQIVCYTEDNLDATEKREAEYNVYRFLNSIKNDTKTFAIQKDSKFYDVKYHDSLSVKEYPKFVEFTIPLKSSLPFGKQLNKKTATGNMTFASQSIVPVGGIITVTGPATSPKFYLNDYEMEFVESEAFTILSGDKLVIDCGNSTVTLVKSNETMVNAMPAYNHQFPKVEPGINELELGTGIQNANQLKLEWYDLKI